MSDASERPADRIVVEPVERRDAVLNTLRGAKSRISVSLFRCTDKAVFAELGAAVDRGVDVQVLVTSRAKGGKKKLRQLWNRLEATGASVYASTDPVVKYHAKYLVVDDGPALITSLNFTRKCFESTCDAIVLTWDPAVVVGLRELMMADCAGRPAPDTLSGRLILGPERARRQFTALISEAKSSIRLIDAKLSDPDVMALLSQRRAEGLDVQVHDAKRMGALKSHGKIMLLDDGKAVVGGLALAALSLDFRREVAIVCDEPGAVRVVRQLFRSIAAADPADGSAPGARAGGASC